MRAIFRQSTDAAPDNFWDAVIIGGGPAGSASAIALANAGWQVLLVEKHRRVNFKLGESLPPSAIGMLQHYLGSVDDKMLTAQGMSKITGNVSCWDSDVAQTSDFFFTPPGFGLRLDRPNFDQSLRTRARESGALVVEGGKIKNLGRKADWQFELIEANKSSEHRAKYLLDCTGRQARIASQIGAKRQVYDHLFAFAQRYTAASSNAKTSSSKKSQTHIEATADGWWYGAQLPDEQRLIVFHTDRDLPAAKLAASASGFKSLLLGSQHISNWLKQGDYTPEGNVRGAPAASERLDQFAGDHWLAVGDAAQSYDPLSSQGIDKALRSGCAAAMAVDQYLKVDQNEQAEQLTHQRTFKKYAQEQERLWQNYQRQYFYYYQSQPRWPERAFWQRRNTDNKSQRGVQTKKEAS